jgi:hypothetical protein
VISFGKYRGFYRNCLVKTQALIPQSVALYLAGKPIPSRTGEL